MAITKVTSSVLEAAQPNITSVGTLTGFTSTGIDDNATSTAITIDSSENVGIGETLPLGKLHIKGSDTGATASAQGNSLVLEDTENGLSILSSTAGAGYINFGDSDDNNVGMIIYGHSSNSMSFWTNAAKRATIDSSGNVGIGTTSPASKLHVQNGALEVNTDSSAAAVVRINYNSTDSIRRIHALETGGGNARPLQIHAQDVRFRDDTTERMRIDSSGRLLVGLTGASGFGTVETDTLTTGGQCILARTGGNVLFGVTSAPSGIVGGSGFIPLSNGRSRLDMASTTTGASTIQVFVNPNGTVGSIETNGSSTTYGTSSDYRLKENVDYDFNALDRVAQLKPARFNFIADADKTVDGFLAHEVQDIVPEAITGTKDAVDDEGNPEYQGIDQSKLVPLLTKAIQELSDKVDNQQTTIDNLTTRIETLENA